jgi:glycosyltransferase involved in cell wall biosynthesis
VLRRKPFGAQRLARFTRSLDAFVTISREIDAELAACGVGPERRAFVPNGVDTRRYSPASPEERRALRVRLELPEGPIAVYTGRLVPEKRADSLIRLWPAVRAACPTATLLLLGEGPQATAWRALAGAGVLFRGKVDNVEEYLRACDLFVLPSLVEGLSNAQLEAMAAGLPALVTDVGGAGDLIAHGESGWLVPPDDAPALEAALLRLLGDERLRARLAAAGRDRVLRDYTLEEAARRLRDLYARLATARERREARPAAPLADPKRRRS